jgi:hypothetical protein
MTNSTLSSQWSTSPRMLAANDSKRSRLAQPSQLLNPSVTLTSKPLHASSHAVTKSKRFEKTPTLLPRTQKTLKEMPGHLACARTTKTNSRAYVKKNRVHDMICRLLFLTFGRAYHNWRVETRDVKGFGRPHYINQKVLRSQRDQIIHLLAEQSATESKIKFSSSYNLGWPTAAPPSVSFLCDWRFATSTHPFAWSCMRLACRNDPPASCAPMRMQGCLSQRLRRDADSKNGLLMPS